MAIINGTAGNDVLNGTEFADQIRGLAGSDILNGFSGDDSLWGGSGNDRILGGDGNDLLDGGAGIDFLDGGQGNDKLNGGQGNDTLWGGNGDDVLNGGDGNDVLKSYGLFNSTSKEYDELTGGGGKDTFDLTDATGSVAYFNDDDQAHTRGFALIKDFKVAEDDKIVLDGFASHYQLTSVFWGKDFGKANNKNRTDVAIVYLGSNGNQYSDVVAVLQDVSPQFVKNPAGYLNNPDVFRFLG